MAASDASALWLAWCAGDVPAFERLYERVAPRLYAFCRVLARGDRTRADDLFQETFRRAVASRGRYRDAWPLEAWLAGIARNASRDMGRAARRRPEVTGEDVDREASPAATDPLALLEGLETSLREAVALRCVQGLSVEESAEVLAVSPATVKRRVAEGLRRLSEKSDIR